MSLFTGSTSTGISGGQFNTAQGVTIIISTDIELKFNEIKLLIFFSDEGSSNHARVSSPSEPQGAAPTERSELVQTTSESAPAFLSILTMVDETHALASLFD